MRSLRETTIWRNKQKTKPQHKQTNKQTNRQTDRQTEQNKQTNKQTNNHAGTCQFSARVRGLMRSLPKTWDYLRKAFFVCLMFFFCYSSAIVGSTEKASFFENFFGHGNSNRESYGNGRHTFFAPNFVSVIFRLSNPVFDIFYFIFWSIFGSKKYFFGSFF